MSRANEFSQSTREVALVRQGNRCASCGTSISRFGYEGRAVLKHGDGAQAHEMRPFGKGGSKSVSNCVILCPSCDYAEYEGGSFDHDTVAGRRVDFPFFESRRSGSKIKPAKSKR